MPPCQEIRAEVAQLQSEIRALQDELRHAPPQEKPAILSLIKDAQRELVKKRLELKKCEAPYVATDTISHAVRKSFVTLVPLINMRRKVLVILWDWHHPNHPAPRKEDVEAAVFGTVNSVSDYLREISNNLFSIENAGVLGWYDAEMGYSYYDGTSKDGWRNSHHRKYAEAIRKAAAHLDFRSFDVSGDGRLTPDEVAILIAVPSSDPVGAGVVRDVKASEIPDKALTLDGATFSVVAEWYIGNPPDVGVAAHELVHLLVGHSDMYFNFFQPFAAGAYSLMDQHFSLPHLDPFAKLKCGWLHPVPLVKTGRYNLPAVAGQSSRTAWILANPHRSLDEYFIVENRQRGTHYDQNLPASGLAVWHIVENPEVYGSLAAPPGTPANQWATVAATDWARRAIRMIRPSLAPPFNDAVALWNGSNPATGYDLLSSDPNPQHATLRWADGTPSGFAIRGISPSGPVMSATVEVPFKF